jgi:hypothetical protein
MLYYSEFISYHLPRFQNSKGCSALKRLSSRYQSHYQLVKHSSHYDLLPVARKSGGVWLSIVGLVVGLFCFGPNAIVAARILFGLYRASLLALESLNFITQIK